MSEQDDVATQEAWLRGVAELPEDRKKAVAEWFLLQRLTAEAFGLEEQAWWELIEWAMKNPLDFSFIEDFPDRGEAGADDATEQDGSAAARTLVGSSVGHVAVAGGAGIAANADSKDSGC
jgi:hypothetical protein